MSGGLYRHATCETPMLRWMGDGDGPVKGHVMMSADWQKPDGSRLEPRSALPMCPDCGDTMKPTSGWLVPV